jgi:hypothetical protein
MTLRSDIDINDIFKEATQDKERILNLISEAVCCEHATDRICQLIGLASSLNPALLIHLITSGMGITSLLQTIAAYTFEAGRLYGRSELQKEMEEGIR